MLTPAQPWKTRPEYQAALLGINEAEYTRRITFGRFLPTVSAVAGYTDQFGFTPAYSEGNWYFGLQASIPLFDTFHASDEPIAAARRGRKFNDTSFSDADVLADGN